ncbi:hypothetical protein AAFF_G00324760 [Aldrovandia affinis]|uniref:Uncharacterized protein n=1 Tax=Aldrovandia affinis TaxID=143900 RepID=A0AAD7TA54_9TELE|nr:hypothetical protein AAFF_G00324760 [Aldrovandia affinis]
MAENETLPPRGMEVLIIPMTAHHPSPEENTFSKRPTVGPPISLTASTKPAAMSSVSPTKNNLPPDSVPHKTERLSLDSSQLLSELIQAHARRSPRMSSPECPPPLASAPTSPNSSPATLSTPPVTPPQPLSPTQERGLSLSSPELVSELKQSRSLRHVKRQHGLTTVFSGRGRMTRGTTRVSEAGQPHPSPNSHAIERKEKSGGPPMANGTQQ